MHNDNYTGHEVRLPQQIHTAHDEYDSLIERFHRSESELNIRVERIVELENQLQESRLKIAEIDAVWPGLIVIFRIGDTEELGWGWRIKLLTPSVRSTNSVRSDASIESPWIHSTYASALSAARKWSSRMKVVELS